MKVDLILKNFSGNGYKLIALIILSIFTSIGIWIKYNYSVDDCSDISKQKEIVMGINTNLVNKNVELIQKIIEINELVNGIKPDTVFIERTREIKVYPPVEIVESIYLSEALMKLEYHDTIEFLESSPYLDSLVFPKAKIDTSGDVKTSFNKKIKDGNLKCVKDSLKIIMETIY
jgi:hypothetical protein